MALLRTKRLWATTIAPGLWVRDSEGQPYVAGTVYTVPAGYRAVLRYMTFVWNDVAVAIPQGVFVEISIKHDATSTRIWRMYLSRLDPTGPVWIVTNFFERIGIVVLHSGNQISIASSLPLTGHTDFHGSGAELRDQSSLQTSSRD